MIRDIIWDFDGTLFDTYPETVNSFLKALKDGGVDETYENVLDCIKVSANFAITHFKELYGLNDDFLDRFNLYSKDTKPEMVSPFPFAEEVCRQLVDLGGRNYIITHRGNSTLEFLQHHGMMCYFTEVITRHQGFKRKPDPEAFMYLIEKYHIDRSEALVVGDRECEILGGRAVGIGTCLYNTNNVSLTAVPDFYVDSLKDLVDIIR